MPSAVRSKVSKARPDSFHIIIGITPVQDPLADSLPRGTRVWIVATPGLVDITGKASICAQSRKAVNSESIEDILQAIESSVTDESSNPASWRKGGLTGSV